jgi:L-lactate dehydrogenase complex protein LldG
VSAREAILARVRAATSGAVSVPGAGPGAGRRPDLRAALLDLFAERVADYRAVVERCSPEELPARVAAAVEGRVAVVPEGLGLEVPDATVDTGLTALELDEVDAVVTEAAVGVAETGTIVLDHGPVRAAAPHAGARPSRVRGPADQVVPDVPDAVAQLDPLRPQTWISGPSATSDIELDRVEGVHGPRSLHVILVG